MAHETDKGNANTAQYLLHSKHHSLQNISSPTAQVGLKDPKWMLAWSNPDIGDEVLIRKALMTARFTTILQACLDFGVTRVEEQWAILSRDPELSARTVPCLINDILDNIEKGFAHVQQRKYVRSSRDYRSGPVKF
jgi:hypothetical protein